MTTITATKAGGVVKSKKDRRKVAKIRTRPKSDIGQRIDDLSLERGYSRTDLAKRCGIIPVSFNRTLVEGHLAARIMPRLASELGVTVNYLITGSQDARADKTTQAIARARGCLDVAEALLAVGPLRENIPPDE